MKKNKFFIYLIILACSQNSFSNQNINNIEKEEDLFLMECFNYFVNKQPPSKDCIFKYNKIKVKEIKENKNLYLVDELFEGYNYMYGITKKQDTTLGNKLLKKTLKSKNTTILNISIDSIK